ncbi:helix-turn-helix domain-containing protein [Enterovirga aerilata]|uniref:Chromosomal replication initiator DnaA C-terminal domain-containing protein n=1 Tax=Enterovirga aerilata TaxID=2730920 RepID=A0A849ICN6_9HYPH|nr:helix-turn-helix domain-containing protein [Enterovirga sp. DB1703]NNM75031.1 hypothetical protein [Enterovirga sp. DB1703]
MEEAARNPRPGKPQPIERMPGELGARAFGAEERATQGQRQQEAFLRQIEQLRAAFAGLPERPAKIIARVAREHGLTAADITGRSQTAPMIRARFAAVAEVRRIRPDLSLPQIGRAFGGRDHTTILSALRKMGLK